MEATCETCRFFRPYSDGDGGTCRRLPPVRKSDLDTIVHWLFIEPDYPEGTNLFAALNAPMYCGADGPRITSRPYAQGLWPEILKRDWCGEHQPRDTEKQDG